MSDPASWNAGIVLFAFVAGIYLPMSCHILPGPIEPGSNKLMVSTLLSALISIGALALLVERNIDPYPFGIIYSGTLMLLCVEVWFREDPLMFNGSASKGFPFFLFHRPGGDRTMAPVPMASSYTRRVFGTWHAGGVCLCFFMHVLANDFPMAQKAQTSLALGLLWLIWATINQWRSVYGGGQFCQMGVMAHSLVGPGCGLCGFWHIWFWHTNRRTSSGKFTTSEYILLGTCASLFFVAVAIWVVVAMKDRRLVTGTKEEGEPLLVREQEGVSTIDED